MGNFLTKEDVKGDILLNNKLTYTLKYNNKFDNLKEVFREVDDIDNLKYFFVIEYVDKYGNIFMKYNNKECRFEYYSDKMIPSEILETISKRYMINSNSKVLKNIKNEGMELKSKKYEDLPDVYGLNKKKTIVNSNKKVDIVDINKFLHLGRIKDLNVLSTSIEKKKNNISYNDYKLLKNIL